MGDERQALPTVSVDPREGTVVGPGGEVRLEPKVMAVLRELAAHPGRVVSRADLMDAVWPDTVVTEHTLSRCIYQLREQLRKVCEEPGVTDYDPIETIPKRGYRLLAKVETTPGGFRATGQGLVIEVRRKHLLFVGLVLFVLAVLGFLVLLGSR